MPSCHPYFFLIPGPVCCVRMLPQPSIQWLMINEIRKIANEQIEVEMDSTRIHQEAAQSPKRK